MDPVDPGQLEDKMAEEGKTKDRKSEEQAVEKEGAAVFFISRVLSAVRPEEEVHGEGEDVTCQQGKKDYDHAGSFLSVIRARFAFRELCFAGCGCLYYNLSAEYSSV